MKSFNLEKMKSFNLGRLESISADVEDRAATLRASFTVTKEKANMLMQHVAHHSGNRFWLVSAPRSYVSDMSNQYEPWPGVRTVTGLDGQFYEDVDEEEEEDMTAWHVYRVVVVDNRGEAPAVTHVITNTARSEEAIRFGAYDGLDEDGRDAYKTGAIVFFIDRIGTVYK